MNKKYVVIRIVISVALCTIIDISWTFVMAAENQNLIVVSSFLKKIYPHMCTSIS